jgi:GT2 family glycosyltransferase
MPLRGLFCTRRINIFMSVVESISVVIPNYNGAHLFPGALPTVFDALEKSGLPYEVIISDDCSTDHSVSFLQSHYPRVKLISNEMNLGFSPTINKGIFAAVNSHILFLNSDVKLTANYFEGLLRYFDREDTFGVMGRIIGWDNDTIQDGGKYPSFHGLKIKTSGNYIPEKSGPCQWLYSMYLSGANAFVDRKKILLLEGFNEMFAPFYVEDYELSVRAWRSGWKCYYDHGTVCRHKESVTIKSKEKKSLVNKIYYRNKMYLHALHLPGILLAPWHIQMFIECLLNVLVLRFYYIQAFFLYLRHWPTVFAKRKKFNAAGRLPGKELLSLKQVTQLVLDNINEAGVLRLK